MDQEAPQDLHIWVDADACPGVVKDILFRVAERLQLNVTLVANQLIRVPGSRFIRALQVPAGPDVADAEIVAQIKELIETRVRPAVANDGGDIVYRGFDQGKVYLRMQGACSGCPSSTATLKNGIEQLLRYYVPEVTEVRAI